MDPLGEINDRHKRPAVMRREAKQLRTLSGVAPPSSGQRRPRVLMLGGFGRSGSTLLERCLAQCEDFAGLGELLHLWERGLRDNELCGCGEPFGQCPVWQQIGQQAFGGWSVLDMDQAVSDRLGVVRNRFLPELIAQRGWGSRRIPRQRLLDNLQKLYEAADQSVAGRVLVDSSKHPAYAYLLRALDIDLRCVLVVRDPRGVAFSWAKVVKRPETGSRDEEMPRYSIPASMFNWTTYSLLFHALSLLKVPVLTVHYEHFMTDPRQTLLRIHRFAGLETAVDRLPSFTGRQIHLDAHHTVAGNPMRFKVGEIRLKLDVAWKEQMKGIDRFLASTLSLPLRLYYRLRGQ
ncbi:sulfotransferase [Glutamicibacter sp. MNS18]|uniref:sulfotransferase n=1 Tax=Glutamicibacter sp. MNS18 TaxID=2989817 RepID=UPI002235C62C|nr:sulfotransferase [Glutamicibacter sp. MNS18]MCW4466148.1 sulfotransferase [Glutamicibacter sp. MNS18]